MRASTKNLAVILCGTLLAATSQLLGCGDDPASPDADVPADTDVDVGPDADTGPDISPDADADADPGTDADADVPDDGPPPGDPCPEGPIGVECVCADALHVTGFCCSDLWFDPVYADLTGGCPGTDDYRYVDPAHSAASDTGPGTVDAPWATIEHGVATIDAGQVLVVRAGTYAVQGTASRYTPALNPAHSGTPGAPVVLKADGLVVITSAPVHTGTARGGSASTIVLAESAASEDGAYEGHVRIVSGTGAGQTRRILRNFDDFSQISYEGATRTAWVSLFDDGAGNWDTPPDATSGYEVVAAGPLAGTLGREHVVWDGFRIVERDSYASDTGPVVLWDSQDVALLHCDVEAATTFLYDNHNALRIEGTQRALVRSNRLHGVQPIEIEHNNPQNHAAIMIYTGTDLVLEHNEIYDSYTGVFPKGGTSGHRIRYNLVRDTTKAFRVSNHADVAIYGNVVRDTRLAFQGAEDNTNLRIFNNVVYRSYSGLSNWFGIEGVDLFNCVFSEVVRPVDLEGAAGTFTMHHNAYHDAHDFILENRDVGGFAAWQALGYDTGSLEVPAPFVDPAADDYHLVPGSPAAAGGRDLEDLDGDGDTTDAVPMGVYVTGTETIGLVR